MNNYNDDVIFLSKESSNAFMASLLFDKEALSRRDKFVSDIANSICFGEDSSRIEVDIPELDLNESEIYTSFQTGINEGVNTGEINISVNVMMTVNKYSGYREMQYYRGSDYVDYSVYSLKTGKLSEQWFTYNVA